MTKPEFNIVTSPTGKRLLSFVTADWYNTAYVGLWLFQVLGLSLDFIVNAADEMLYEMFPQTATWTIPYWEQVYGIEPDDTLSLDYRRQRILSRNLYQPPINPAHIEAVISALTGSPVHITEEVEPYTFRIEIDVAGGQAVDYLAAHRALREIKPSHLAFSLKGVTPFFSGLNGGGAAYVVDNTRIGKSPINTQVSIRGSPINYGGLSENAGSTRIHKNPINTQVSIRGSPINYGGLSENAESTKVSRVPANTSTPIPPTIIFGGGISESHESTALSMSDITTVTPMSGNANLGGSFAQTANSSRLGRLTIDKSVTPFDQNLNSGGAIAQSAMQSKLRKLTANKQVTTMSGSAHFGGAFTQTVNAARLGRLTVDKLVTPFGGNLNSGGTVRQSATQSIIQKLITDKQVTPMSGNANLGGSFAQTANSSRLGRLTADKSVTLLSTVWYMGGVTLTSTSTRLSEPMQIAEDGYVLTDSGTAEPAFIMVDGGEYPLSLSL
jgi:hypothetical protein